ncbi:MAG TPA: S8 family serine peptidase, partial [Candidatus Kapabacteria bacterium]|nr:S8 family serine peptidase [Candidatus Kapabacteria bacterium]
MDDWQGWDFAGGTQGAAQDNDPSGVQNSLAHGIHVAGIAAAVMNNHIGVAGIAPKCRLMLVKAAYDDQADNIQFGFEGIAYAVDHGARIINCSWGGESPSSSEQDVVNYANSKGTLIVAAAGNNDNSLPLYPASYNHVLSVTASTTSDGPDIFFSNFGTTVDVIAPGDNILSTYYGNSYATLSGTSMATPCASGVAALVASHFPTYTADQIAARVRVTSDPIDSQLYYTYQRLFGFGRINAYRAVHDTNVKAVAIDSFYVSNDDNNDGILEPGETGSIRVRLKNLLSPTVQLTATLVDSISGGTADNMQNGIDPYVTISNPNDYVGAMQTFGTSLTPSNTFNVHVAANTPQNYLLHFRVDFADGAYHDYQYFTLFINPTFVTMDMNDISCTFNSRGDDAFNDFPSNTQGIGFTYKNGTNLLFEGALMIATDAAHVVNVARDNPSGGQDTDFTMTQRAALNTDASAGTQEATAAWSDANADPTRKLGVSVSMHNYEYTTPGNTNFVIITYTIQNTSSQTLKDLCCGIYLDWDIGPNGDSNYVTYDDPYRLGWISKVNSTAYPVCGSALLSSQAPSFYAIDNNPNSSNPPFTVNSGFTFAEKYTCLSSGIGRHNSSIGDVGNTIGGGPITLAPGQKDTFAFALLAGNTLNSLEQGVIAARQLWQNILKNERAHVNIFYPGTDEFNAHD